VSGASVVPGRFSLCTSSSPCPLLVLQADQSGCSLGGSGSGKTTLLNAIADRLAGLPVESGEVVYSSKIGGPKLGKGEVKRRIGFVRQQDYLVHCLTGRYLVMDFHP